MITDEHSLRSAVCLYEKGDFEAAETICRECITSAPDNDIAHHVMGLSIAKHGEQQRNIDEMYRGIAWIQKAIELQDKQQVYNRYNYVHAHCNIGTFYRLTGDAQKARNYFEKAITIDPTNVAALDGLYDLIDDDDKTQRALLLTIHRQLQISHLSDDAKHRFHFAAGHLCAKQHQYNDAFRHYVAGNRLANKTYSVDKEMQYAKNIIFLFNDQYVASRTRCGVRTDQFIFIVGMPRTGSSLVEQILASHPDVIGIGECDSVTSAINKLVAQHKMSFPHFVPFMRNHTITLCAQACLQRMKNIAKKDCQRIICKQLINFFYIGFIHDMFPHARFIYMTRNPLDTCLSCFFHNFIDAPYTFDLSHVGKRYLICRRMMEHWQHLFPQQILTIEYEKLVAHPDTISHDIVAFCGLPWNEKCLSFFNTKRLVDTASSLQVRKPIHQRSVGIHKHYKQHLEPLKQALRTSVEDQIDENVM
jgi:tetratricopeptide (TPR) repeat protein